MNKLGIIVALLVIASIVPGLIGCGPTTPTTPTTSTTPTTPTIPPTSTTPTTPTATTTPTTAAKLYYLKWADWDPPVSVYVRNTTLPWIQLIEKESGGRIKISYFGTESLVKRPDLYDALLNGIADITLFSASSGPGRFPLLEVADLPFLYQGSAICGLSLWDAYKQGAFGKDLTDVHLLAFRPNAPSNITNRTKPIKTAADWKGQKFGGSGVIVQGLCDLMGATFVGLGSAERYDGLQKGMIDMTAIEWEGQYAWKFYEVTKYRTTGADMTITAAMWYAMSQKAYDNLPADLKALIDKYTGEWMTKLATSNMDRETYLRYTQIVESDKKRGLEPVYVLPKTERDNWIAMMKPLYDKTVSDREAKGLPAKATLAKIQELSAKYAAMYPPGSDAEYKLWKDFGQGSVFPGLPTDFVMPPR